MKKAGTFTAESHALHMCHVLHISWNLSPFPLSPFVYGKPGKEWVRRLRILATGSDPAKTRAHSNGTIMCYCPCCCIKLLSGAGPSLVGIGFRWQTATHLECRRDCVPAAATISCVCTQRIKGPPRQDINIKGVHKCHGVRKCRRRADATNDGSEGENFEFSVCLGSHFRTSWHKVDLPGKGNT